MGGVSHISFSDGCRGVLSLQTGIIMLSGLGVAWGMAWDSRSSDDFILQ